MRVLDGLRLVVCASQSLRLRLSPSSPERRLGLESDRLPFLRDVRAVDYTGSLHDCPWEADPMVPC